ncbi:MAG: hypothetical protein PHQ12_01575 [Chthoniobacteraceae bacterium]|nr:hypothetical protein [Chthoniobacteraceae bacterium]
MNRLSIGMTKQDVIAAMGTPVSTAAPGGGVEILRYGLTAEAFTVPQEYFVRLVNGKVDAYGRMGDFSSTQNPTYNLNIKNR